MYAVIVIGNDGRYYVYTFDKQEAQQAFYTEQLRCYGHAQTFIVQQIIHTAA